MWSKLTYRKKLFLICSGFSLTILLACTTSFSDTLAMRNRVKEKSEKLKWLQEKELGLPALQKQMDEFVKAYSQKQDVGVREALTGYISAYAEKNDCVVTDIPINSTFDNKNLKVQTNSYTIKGGFKNLLLLIDGLERDCRYLTKIMSARFYTQRDHQAKRKFLYLVLITQSFEQNKN